jgi:molybdopterin-containing oxidoreductase family iron-sulfur binding subunit
MSTNRRDFLRATGVTILGIGGAAPIIAASSRQHEHQPAAAPAGSKGKRYALAIDHTKCDVCPNRSACVDACHTTHNVPSWEGREEEVKWIWREGLEEVFPAKVNEYSSAELRHRGLLVMCNHCDEPPCTKVCPTQATFKREDGPVMMDMHRCIGCRYCIVGCPYGARSFNWKDPRDYFREQHGGQPSNPRYPTRQKGVVEKCTMCTERLAKGLEPACVEACKEHGAGGMIFGDMEDEGSEIRRYVQSKLVVRRRAELGTRPQVYYTL